MATYPQKITFGEMRNSGVREVLIYCWDHRCSHSATLSADQWPDNVRLSDVEPGFVCTACGHRGAEIRPNLARQDGHRLVPRPSDFIPPCQPSKVARPPSGALWVHEIKHDGYRLMVRRDGSRVRCFTRNGHDWADRFPAIVDAASASTQRRS